MKLQWCVGTISLCSVKGLRINYSAWSWCSRDATITVWRQRGRNLNFSEKKSVFEACSHKQKNRKESCEKCSNSKMKAPWILKVLRAVSFSWFSYEIYLRSRGNFWNICTNYSRKRRIFFGQKNAKMPLECWNLHFCRHLNRVARTADVYILTTEASLKCMGRISTQYDQRLDEIVANTNKKLTKNQKNRSAAERDLLAVLRSTSYSKTKCLGWNWLIASDPWVSVW